MINKYGKNVKFFKCIKDKLFFCIKNKNYYIKCPLCNRYICYYCSFYTYSEENKWISCCLKRSISEHILYNSPNYNGKEFLIENKIFFIPGINLFTIFIRFY